MSEIDFEKAKIGTELPPTLREHISTTVGKYLNPPYRWDLPEEKLQTVDADYEFFMCRGNLLT